MEIVDYQLSVERLAIRSSVRPRDFRKVLAIAHLAGVYEKAGPMYRDKDCHAQIYETSDDQRRNSSHRRRYR